MTVTEAEAGWLAFAALGLWGSWPNVSKLAEKATWAQLFPWHCAGACTTLVAAALLTGSVACDPAVAVASGSAGALCALGMMLILESMEVVGLAVACPIGLGIEMAVGTPLMYVLDRSRVHLAWLCVGLVCALCAIATNAAAKDREEEDPKKTFAGVFSQDLPRAEESLPLVDHDVRRSARRGIRAAVVAGLLFSAWPLIEDMVVVQRGASLSTFLACFAAGFLLATVIVLPCLGLSESYCEARIAGLGIAAGSAWGFGAFLVLTAGLVLGNAAALSICRCAPLVAATWGVLLWDEGTDAAPLKTRILIVFTFLLYLGAVAAFCNSADTANRR